MLGSSSKPKRAVAKPKLDSKVRFGSKKFTTKLSQARDFKREAKPVSSARPASVAQRNTSLSSSFLKVINEILGSVGLGSRWTQALALLLLLLVGYLIYFPNPFSIKNIEIQGLQRSEAVLVESDFRNVLGSSPWYKPVKNLLILDNEFVTDEVVKRHQFIDSLVAVEKKFENQTVLLIFKRKSERFLVRDNKAVYDYFSDGSFKAISEINRDYWFDVPAKNMIKIDYPGDLSQDPSLQQVVIKNTFAYINSFGDELARKKFIDSYHFYIPEGAEGNGQIELVARRTNNVSDVFKVIVSLEQNPPKIARNLQILLSQISKDDYSKLEYIDMRIEDKSFVCLKGAECSSDFKKNQEQSPEQSAESESGSNSEADLNLDENQSNPEASTTSP